MKQNISSSEMRSGPPLRPLMAAQTGLPSNVRRGARGLRIPWRDQVAGMLFAAPYLVGAALFLILPLCIAAYYSFCHYTMLQPPIWVGLRNYFSLLHDQSFHKALINTIIYAGASLPLTLVASVALAILLNMQVRGQAVYRTIIFLPSLVPLVATGVLWGWLLNSDKGLVNYLLAPVVRLVGHLLAATAGLVGASPRDVQSLRGLSPPVWLTDPRWAMPVIIFLSLWGIGQTVVIFLAGLQDIPRELYEAANMDGAGTFQRLRHVTLPMLSPVIFFNLIMGVIGSWQVFDLPYVMTQGGPDKTTLFYSMYVFNAGMKQLRMGAASAMAIVQLCIILLLTALAFWSARKWVHYT